MLPIEIQMQIDLSVQRHHRELAAAFEALRESRLPPPMAAEGLRNIVISGGSLFQMTDCTFDVSPLPGIVIRLDELSAAKIRASRYF